MVIYYDDSTVDFISGLFWLIVFWVAPIFIGFHICRSRNRDPIKGLFVTFCTGWIGAISLWLALKRRHPRSKMLY